MIGNMIELNIVFFSPTKMRKGFMLQVSTCYDAYLGSQVHRNLSPRMEKCHELM